MSWKVALCTGLLVFGVLGCQDAPQVKKENVDAGTKLPVADRHIAAAVASVASSANPQNPGTNEGPPPNGVFAAGEADKRVKPNVPVVATIIDTGSDPKLKFLPLNTFISPQPFEFTVVFMEGRAPKAVKLDLVATLPQAAAGAEGEGADAPKPAPEGEDAEKEEAPKPEPITKPTAIHFTIMGVRAHDELPLTDDDLKKFNTLKGTRVAAVITPNGGLTGETFELSKSADPTKMPAVRALVDMISLFFSPWPGAPVGVGAYWIVSDRANMGGLDLVRYRVFKIEQLKGGELSLSVDLRMYAAGPGSVPPGAPASSIAMKFQGQGKAMLSRRRGQLLPIQGQLQAPIQLQFAQSADAQVGQMYQLQYAAGWAPILPAKEGDEKATPGKAPAPRRAPGGVPGKAPGGVPAKAPGGVVPGKAPGGVPGAKAP